MQVCRVACCGVSLWVAGGQGVAFPPSGSARDSHRAPSIAGSALDDGFRPAVDGGLRAGFESVDRRSQTQGTRFAGGGRRGGRCGCLVLFEARVTGDPPVYDALQAALLVGLLHAGLAVLRAVAYACQYGCASTSMCGINMNLYDALQLWSLVSPCRPRSTALCCICMCARKMFASVSVCDYV